MFIRLAKRYELLHLGREQTAVRELFYAHFLDLPGLVYRYTYPNIDTRFAERTHRDHFLRLVERYAYFRLNRFKSEYRKEAILGLIHDSPCVVSLVRTSYDEKDQGDEIYFSMEFLAENQRHIDSLGVLERKVWNRSNQWLSEFGNIPFWPLAKDRGDSFPLNQALSSDLKADRITTRDVHQTMDKELGTSVDLLREWAAWNSGQ